MTDSIYPDLSNVKKILVIKLRHLGDVLLTSPVFSTLRQRFPKARIDAYVYSDSLCLVDENPEIDSCLEYPLAWKKKKFFSKIYHEWTLLRKIRSRKYDLVINLTEGDRGAIVAKFSGASIRVGFDPEGTGMFGKSKLYTHLVQFCPNPRHAVERNLDTLRRIGIFPTFAQKELFLPVQKNALEKMKALVGEGFILIHPASRWNFKCWPAEKMRELALALESDGRKLVFTSGPAADEKEMLRQISEGLQGINLAGQISLRELGALVSLCEMVICVDSLPFHMANALKKPVVALFGPSSELNWGTWRNEKAKVITQLFSCRPCNQEGCGGSRVSDCLVTIPVERVLRAVRGENPLRSSCCGPQGLKQVGQPSLQETPFPLG